MQRTAGDGKEGTGLPSGRALVEHPLRVPERVRHAEHVLVDHGEIGSFERALGSRQLLHGVLSGSTAVGYERETVRAARAGETVEVPLELHEGGGLPGPEPAQGCREFSNPLRRLAEIDKTLLIHDAALREMLQKLRPLLEPPPAPPKPEIGFHVKEDAIPYRTKRKATS